MRKEGRRHIRQLATFVISVNALRRPCGTVDLWTLMAKPVFAMKLTDIWKKAHTSLSLKTLRNESEMLVSFDYTVPG